MILEVLSNLAFYDTLFAKANGDVTSVHDVDLSCCCFSPIMLSILIPHAVPGCGLALRDAVGWV